MFSQTLKSALQQEVVGQSYAINAVVRGVTRLMSGMTPRERSWCVELFIGPRGTGRAHLIRTLGRVLHHGECALTVNGSSAGQPDPWAWFCRQLVPLVGAPRAPGRPPTLLLIQDLEDARPELYPALARFLETGRLLMPDGRQAELANCMVFLTSGLCTDRILDTQIGFSNHLEEDAALGAIAEVCRVEAERRFGTDLVSQVDDLVVFRRLEKEHLARILERHAARLNRWLEQRGIRSTLAESARAFLLECGSHQANLGAHDLILAHRNEVEFPLADLLISGRLARGAHVAVEHRPDEEHLHFTVSRGDEDVALTAPEDVLRIPVA